ncbi:hypothetical protein J416_12749 [Gracilibacillus halophilus YIM-C55.5]|uniref:DUF5673 domain-containing protein n=1 Tax=Gracilibacillus halophilus YIM-C55.5 TaxID=1308866 RepID=N4W770_9BACI|nr:hypothetical protein [Gracilibacillus halophilus]ENH96073.1 hypothetical protein J416_12749 [Gracilibacillus halophilus YIM-C55.5]
MGSNIIHISFTLLFLSIFGYYLFQFILVLVKMKQPVLLPVTEEERQGLQLQMDRKINAPIYRQQKLGIILISFIFLFALALFLWIIFNGDNLFAAAYSLFLVISTGLTNLINQFAIQRDGILSGTTFIPWDKVKSFEFIPIDVNHKYFGFSKEVNHQYELKIKATCRSVSCIVLTQEMREKLREELNQHIF